MMATNGWAVLTGLLATAAAPVVLKLAPAATWETGGFHPIIVSPQMYADLQQLRPTLAACCKPWQKIPRIATASDFYQNPPEA